MKRKQLWSILMVLLLILSSLTACSAEVGNGGAMMDAPSEKGGGIYENLGSSSESAAQGVKNQKLIRTISIDAETEDLPALMGQIEAKITALGGYVESKNLRYSGSRYANLTIRIPVAKLDEFVSHVSGATNIVFSTENTEDVTLSYVATQSRMKALQTEESRLLELLEQAKGLDELLKLESRLTEVRTELEKVTSQLRLYDNLVDYGTVKLELQEVEVYTEPEEPTVWERISTGFSRSMKNMTRGMTNLFVYFVTRLPYLIPVAVIALIVLLIVKLVTRKRKPPKITPPQPPKENP